MEIMNEGKPFRHFIPCYRKSDNVIGLYDLVEGTFYTNSGTGTFTKGSDVNNILDCKPHYVIAEGTTNLLPANVRQITSTQSQYYAGKREIVYEDGYKCLAVTNSINSTYTDGVIFNGVTLTAGTKYTASALIKSPCTLRFSMRNTNNGGYGPSIYKSGDNTWKKFVLTFTASADNGSTSGVIECVENTANTTSYTWYIRDVQIEAKDHATPFVDGTRPDNTII